MRQEEKDDNYSSPIKFPCDFPIKVMGKTNDEFLPAILKIVQTEFPDITKQDFSSRLSKENKYQSLTVTVKAESQTQLDAIYGEISKCPLVTMAL